MTSPIIVLIPFDTDSESHIDRLVKQRIACGWGAAAVPAVVKRQQERKFMVYWVVPHPDNPKAEELLSLHLAKNPEEITALKNRAESAPRSFHPVGHISLNFDDEPDLVDHEKGLFCISEFFISHQLQGSGVGKAAMNALENIAKAPPINAKMLSLRCRSSLTERSELEGVYGEIGQEIPMNVEEWYKKRGYEVIRTKEEGLRHDGFAREYIFKWSYMRKSLESGA